MYQTEGKNQCFKCIKDRGIVACHDRLQNLRKPLRRRSKSMMSVETTQRRELRSSGPYKTLAEPLPILGVAPPFMFVLTGG